MNEGSSENVKTLIIDLLEIGKELSTQVNTLSDNNIGIKNNIIKYNELIKELFQKIYSNEKRILELSQTTDEFYEEILENYKEISGNHDIFDKRMRKIELRPLMMINNNTKKIFSLEEKEISIINFFKKNYDDDAEVWSLIGHIYWNISNPHEEIFDCFEKSLKLDDTDPCTWCAYATFKSGEADEQIEALDKAVSYKDNLTCTTFMNNIGTKYAMLGYPDKGIKLIDKGISVMKNNTKLYYNKAYIIQHYKKDIPKAMNIIDDGLILNENDVELLILKGNLLDRLFRTNDAEETLLKAYQIDKTNYNVNGNLTRIYVNKKEYKKALMYSDVVISYDVNAICDICLRSKILIELEKIDEAYDLINNNFEKSKDCGPIIGNYINILLNKKMEKKANDFYDESKEKMTQGNLISILSSVVDYEKEFALKIFNDININEIEAPYSINSYAYSAYQLSQSSKAYEKMTELIKKEDENPAFLDTYACILSQIGEIDRAYEMFEKAISYTDSKSNITYEELERVSKEKGLTKLLKEYNKLI